MISENKILTILKESFRSRLLSWCKSQQDFLVLSDLEKGVISHKLFYNFGVLTHRERGRYTNRIVEATQEPRLKTLGERLYPGSHCCSLEKYPSRGKIQYKKTPNILAPKIVQITVENPGILVEGSDRIDLAEGSVIQFEPTNKTYLQNNYQSLNKDRWLLKFYKITPKALQEYEYQKNYLQEDLWKQAM